MTKYRLDAPTALERIKEDRLITINDNKGNTSKLVVEIVAKILMSQKIIKIHSSVMNEVFSLKKLPCEPV